MKHRKSNFELLRIVAMLMIIDVHYFAACNAGECTTAYGGNWIIYHILESAGICGVNLFVLITGFFSYEKETIKVRKIVNLICEVAFWGGTGFLLSVLAAWKDADLKELIKAVFPIFFGGRWFVKIYIILLCMIPFLNILINLLTKESFRILLVISLVLFSVWPSFLPYPPVNDHGYGIVQFILLYIIAVYMRLHCEKYPPKAVCLLGYLVSASVVCAASILGMNDAWAYSHIFVIVEAVCLFMFFAQLEIRSIWVNKIASNAFGVFLIHTESFFSIVVYDKLLRCNELVCGNALLFLASAVISLPVFYLLGFVLESVKKKVFDLTVNPLLDKSILLNKSITINKNEC